MQHVVYYLQKSYRKTNNLISFVATIKYFYSLRTLHVLLKTLELLS